MTLREARCKFTGMLALLITYAKSLGYEIAIGKDGLKHMPGSLHFEGLAEDFDLYKDGIWIIDATGHKDLGEYWIGLGGSWGGYFKGENEGDYNHYSFAWDGRK
jgi:hypothetical protein